MKGLFYCQSYYAAAPLIRSFNLCRSLVKDFEIDFLYGGQEIEIEEKLPRFNLIQLSPFNLKRGKDLIMEYEVGSPLNSAIFEKRWESIRQSIQNARYDFFISELFPLAKFIVEKEIIKIIETVKKNNPACLIFSSVRDVMDLYSFQFGKTIKQVIDRYYDYIFVHSDPLLISIRETFPAASKIQNKIIHTGFIPNKIGNKALPRLRKKQIVVSIGGGSFGQELLEAVAAITPSFPEYQFIFILGPQCPETYKQEFIHVHPDLMVESFIGDFEAILSQSCLSISLGGYTLVDVICTKTPAIALPLAYQDQLWRTSRLDYLGLVKKIGKDDLQKENLIRIVRKVLDLPYPDYPINTEGAENTRKEIVRLLDLETR